MSLAVEGLGHGARILAAQPVQEPGEGAQRRHLTPVAERQGCAWATVYEDPHQHEAVGRSASGAEARSADLALAFSPPVGEGVQRRLAHGPLVVGLC